MHYSPVLLQSPSTTPSTEVSGGGVASLRAGRPALIPSHEGGKMREEDEQERQRLTSELQEIERERSVGCIRVCVSLLVNCYRQIWQTLRYYNCQSFKAGAIHL